jgi:hypothetical protein
MNLKGFRSVIVGLLIAFGFPAVFKGNEAIAGDARLKAFTCSGELWNVLTDPAGTSWLEIGRGIHQCSVRDASSENAKKILSVCNLNADCSMKVNVDGQRLRKSAADGECDDVCIFEGDKIVWVKKGKAQ